MPRAAQASSGVLTPCAAHGMTAALTSPKPRPGSKAAQLQLLRTGAEAFEAFLPAIESAEKSIRLEMYIVRASPLAEQVREALVQACGRGVRVQVLLDGLGSVNLPAAFLDPIRAAGGECRWFHRITFGHVSIRNHRKLLVVDDSLALIGGFNLAPEYQGDGVIHGWRDIGLLLRNSMVPPLAASFDAIFQPAEAKPKWFPRFRKSLSRQKISTPDGDVLLGGPGRFPNPMVDSLLADLRRARKVQIISAYFLPSRRLRGALRRVVRRGGSVELILAGKSDVLMSQLAARHLYQRLLRFGVKIYEYQPQILHSKLFIMDDVVYVGSANLDRRSLFINYELLCRFQQADLTREARELFEKDLTHCRPIELAEWRRARTFWKKLTESWAYFILTRIDPHLAQWELRAFTGPPG